MGENSPTSVIMEGVFLMLICGTITEILLLESKEDIERVKSSNA